MRRVCVIATTIAAIALPAAIWACSGAAAGPASGYSSVVQRVSAATGSVSWDLPLGEPTSLDPIKAYDYSSSAVLSLICDSLLWQSPQGRLIPDLAKTWTHPTPTTWVYTLRAGVRFWDGRPLTVADVVYSLKRNLNSKSGSFYTYPWGASIKSVVATGSNKITVTTTSPNIEINEYMVTGLGQVEEKHFLTAKGQSNGSPKTGVMCSGPFKLVRWTPGSDILLASNASYWNKALVPKISQLDLKFITDPSALTHALTSGGIDGAYEAPLTGLSSLQHSSSGRLYLGPNRQFLAMFIAHAGGLLGSPKVRQALSLMIDRAGLAKAVYQGTGTPLFSFVPPSLPGYGKSAFAAVEAKLATKPDVARAKALIAAAKPPNTVGVLAVTAGDTAADQAAIAVQSAASQLGLKLQIRQLPGAQFGELFFDPKTRAHYVAFIGGGYAATPDPLELFILNALPSSVINLIRYNDPTTTHLVLTAAGTVNPNQRAALLAKAEERLQENPQNINLIAFQERLYMSNRISGAPKCFCYIGYPWAATIHMK